MPNPCENATIAARAADKQLYGVMVSINRGWTPNMAVAEATVNATVASTTTEEVGDEVVVVTRFRDYLIDVDQYDAGGGPTKPQENDVIGEIVNGLLSLFEVLPAGGNTAFEYSDNTRRTWRIHTKEVTQLT